MSGKYPDIGWLRHPEADVFDGMKIHHALAEYRFTTTHPAIGVDPGRRWGLSFLDDGILYAYWGTFPKVEHHQEYYGVVEDFVRRWIPPKCRADVVMVEGPAYGEVFGQPLLEDIRLGFYQGFKNRGYKVEYVSPQTARKVSLGNGRTKASEIFLSIDKNAADAAAICLYAGGFRIEDIHE